jgi:4-amino-4-deoxy-L-arabinose transferase
MLALMLTSAMASFFVAYSAEERKRKLLFLVLFGVFCAFAFLIKGFLAFVIPVVVIAPFLLLQKRWRDIFVLPWLPLIVVLVVVVPWAISIHLHEGDFWRYFFWEEHIARFAAEDAQHRAPFWYYIPVLIGGALPWVFLFPAAISGLIKRRDDNLLVKYSLCWLIFPFLFFSISKGKLGTYILPVFVPLIILFSIGI